MVAKKKKFWLIGTIFSFVGVILVRVVAQKDELADYKDIILIAGISIALLGLMVITFAYRYKIDKKKPDET